MKNPGNEQRLVIDSSQIVSGNQNLFLLQPGLLPADHPSWPLAP